MAEGHRKEGGKRGRQPHVIRRYHQKETEKLTLSPLGCPIGSLETLHQSLGSLPCRLLSPPSPESLAICLPLHIAHLVKG